MSPPTQLEAGEATVEDVLPGEAAVADAARRSLDGHARGPARVWPFLGPAFTLGGSEETKKKYLGMLTESPKLASFCLTEPDAGSDVSGMKTKAVKKGDKYVISGSKCFITNGTYADYFTVFAKTDPEAGHRGISAFVVDADLPGVSVDKKEDKMGQRASNTATISFDEVEIPAENLLGEENKGFKLAMMTLDRTRPGVSAMAVGIGRAALEYATDYSKERVQFGVPIAMHQAIQFMIADMATKVEAGRLLTWNSAFLLDQGSPQQQGLLDGQALRRRLGDGGHHRRRPGLRRLRLHQGVPGRETDARREDHAALRGDQPDPAPGHRQRSAAAAPGRRRAEPEADAKARAVRAEPAEQAAATV